MANADGGSDPLISVVIPVHNGERHVAAAVTSALAQSWTTMECIVVDDGSTDGTLEVLNTFADDRMRVVSQPQGGVSRARNRGIAEAAGKYVALLDADDVWLDGKLAAQVRAFRADERVDLVVCAYALTDEHLLPTMVIHPDPHDRRFRRWLLGEGNGAAFSSTAMIRASALAASGLFDPELSTSADLELAVRLALRSAAAVVDEPLVLYRVHSGQMHRDLDVLESDMEEVLARHAVAVAGSGGLRRGRANLHTRLFVYALQQRRPALRHFWEVLRCGPIRLVALPLEASLRRRRRRARQGRDLSGLQAALERGDTAR